MREKEIEKQLFDYIFHSNKGKIHPLLRDSHFHTQGKNAPLLLIAKTTTDLNKKCVCVAETGVKQLA